MKNKLIIAFSTLICFVSCQGQTTEKTQIIPAIEFAEKIKNTPNAQIIDVRTPQEFTVDHLENAQNINWLDTEFAPNTNKLNKTKPVFIYCKAGSRSHKAAAKLEELGFVAIYELQGGILKWEADGLAKPSNKRIGINREQFDAFLHSEKKVLINFFAPWCAPCKKMEPFILKMQQDMKNKVIIVRLNADENKTIMKELKIEELPTLLLYENNNLKWQGSGFISEEDLKKQIQ